jgi:hypothetical protein
VPRVSEFHHSGHIVFDALLGEKYQCYRAFRMPWTGLPAEAPAIAMTGHGSDLTVYASWNGATDVHSWQLLAGSRTGDLRPVSRTRSRGFESALRTTSSAGPHFAVQALDAGGTPLGLSNTVLEQRTV